MNNGIFSKNCITDFPAVTYPTQASMITGTYTGDYKKEFCHGVPLMDWLDRDKIPPSLRSYAAKDMQIYKINEDLGNNCRTILEMVGEGNTTSITQFINRGTKYFYPERRTKLALFYLLLYYSQNTKKTMVRVNSLVVQKLLETFKNPKKFFNNKEPPIASLLWFVSSDILLHLFGSDSWIYKLNLLHIDKVIGLLINELDKLGYLSDTVIAITSDHGNYKADRLGNLQSFLNRNKLIQYHPRKKKRGNFDLAKYDGVGFFYFKGTNNSDKKYQWSPPTLMDLESYGPNKINLLNQLFKIDASQLMFYRGDNNTSKEGIIYLKKRCKENNQILTSIIEYQGTGFDYKTRYIPNDEENDMFNYFNDTTACQLLDNKFHTTQEWLMATYHLDYPMLPDLIPRHFKNPRSADIILSNDGSIVYNIHHGKQTGKNISNHDLGLKRCMNVPLIIGGSLEIPSKELTYCKITDIVPTLLKLLGKNPHKSVVGSSLV